MAKFDIAIIGGGTGGIMIAAQFRTQFPKLSLCIIEPSDTHWYQPAWTLVGAGTYQMEKTHRPMSSLIPTGVKWIRDKVTTIAAEANQLGLEKSGHIDYRFLIVAPGLVYAPEMIEGLTEALERKTVVSNYLDPNETWKQLQDFKGGNAVFTQPSTPIKCGGAPQKAAYMSADYFRKSGKDKSTNTIYTTPGGVIFGVKPVAETLLKVMDRYHIHFRNFYHLTKIDSDAKTVQFQCKAPEGKQCVEVNPKLNEHKFENGDIEIPFDFLHLAPPQVAPKFVQDAGLCNESGWLDVHIHTLVHNKYSNIYGLGDVAALPTAKTGAAIRKQVPVVIDGITNKLGINTKQPKQYNGYSSCPLVTGYGKMVLAEFDYGNNFMPDPKLKQLLISDSSKEHWRLWMLKKYGLPYLYWNKMMKGIDV